MSGKRGFVKWLATYVGLSGRELANLARNGKIPGVVRSSNLYNYDWTKDPAALATWVRDRGRFRKGNRKRPKKQNSRVTELEVLERAIRRVNILLANDSVRIQIRRAPENRLRRLELALLRITSLLGTIERVRRTGPDF